MPVDPLDRLKKAHATKRRADAAFRAALVAAVDAHGFAAPGHVIGWSRQRVREQLRRWTETGDRAP